MVLKNLDKDILCKFFNAGGYVLDFSTEKFNLFTQDSVGVRLCDRYRLSKGKSLESFTREAPDTLVIKLFSDLMEYYEAYNDPSACKGPEALQYKKCKEILGTSNSENEQTTTNKQSSIDEINANVIKVQEKTNEINENVLKVLRKQEQSQDIALNTLLNNLLLYPVGEDGPYILTPAASDTNLMAALKPISMSKFFETHKDMLIKQTSRNPFKDYDDFEKTAVQKRETEDASSWKLRKK